MSADMTTGQLSFLPFVGW